MRTTPFNQTLSAAVGSELAECNPPDTDDSGNAIQYSLNDRLSPEAPSCRTQRNNSYSSSRSLFPRRVSILYLTLAVFLVIDLYASPAFLAAAAKSKKKKKVDEAAVKSKCTVCRSLVKKFMEGLEKTKKSGYGGGNTAWEEKSLGRNSFAKSETRFVEIMEKVCNDVSGETEKFYCGNIVEEHEEDIEDWYQSDKEADGLEEVLCVKALKVCCPYGFWGPLCLSCTDGTSVFCNGRGDCKGNGTRVGDGKCDCQWPYKGEICTECQSGHFHDETHSNDTHVICEKCDQACGDDGCKGPQTSDCLNCATGYDMTESEDQKGCVDVDECAKNPCVTTEYCANSVGSYSCNKCDKICDPESGCTGGAASDCVSCRSGAEWDADRKNCHVTDWEKYDESLKEETDEDEPVEAIDEDKAKTAELKSKLEELKAELGGGNKDDASHDEL